MRKIIFIFIFFTLNGYCQQKLDSFINKYHQIEKVTEQIAFLDSLNNISKNNIIKYKTNVLLARIYYKQLDSFMIAKKHLYLAKVFANNLNDSTMVDVLSNYGYLFQKEAKFDSAFYFYNKALKVTSNKKLLSRVNANIARVLRKQNKYIQAIKYYHKAIELGNKSSRNLCTAYNNFGSLYLELEKNDSALYYFNKSLQIAKQHKNKRKELRANINLALVYLDNPSTYNKAYTILSHSEEMAKKIKAHYYLYYIQFHLGEYFHLTKRPKLAIKYYNLVLHSHYAKTDYLKQMEVLKTIAKFYEKYANYKKANQYLRQYHKLKDSIYSIEKDKTFNDIKTKYEVENKDIKITLLTKEKQIEKANKNIILITSIFVLVLLLLFIYLLKHKIKIQRIAQEQKKELFKQELKTKNVLSLIKGQENERNRLAKELHDGLGGQLSGIKSIIQTINNDNLQEKTKQLDKHLSKSIKNLRNISHDLSTNFLKNKDFDVLIFQLVVQYFENKNIKTEVSLFPRYKINTLSERYKLNIYRILQESFQNIIKHANANFVLLNLSINDEINILIEDNGKGFNKGKIKKGIGLQNINDRLQSLKGTLYIDSKLNRGTTININIPML